MNSHYYYVYKTEPLRKASPTGEEFMRPPPLPTELLDFHSFWIGSGRRAGVATPEMLLLK